jgi:two-component system, NtrC family, response regulator HydG
LQFCRGCPYFANVLLTIKLDREQKSMKVLVADDNAEFLDNVREIIELLGFEAVTASDGIEAVKKVVEEKPDLILMDIKMPGMDGVSAFRKIKDISPKTPVILITAFAAEEVVEGALREGVFGCLRKPINFDGLFEIIQNAISGGKLVLVVDDNKEFTENVKDVLDHQGYRTNVAHDGVKAVAAAHENKYDVILLDMKLPYLNGLEVYKQVRQLRPDVTVIVATGVPDEMGVLAEEAVEKSAYAALEKPLDMDKLLALLARINEQKEKGKLEKPGKEPDSK